MFGWTMEMLSPADWEAMTRLHPWTLHRKEDFFFFFSLSAGFLAFDMMHVFLSVPLPEFDAFSSSILQLIPLPPFPWENLNCWIDVVVLFSMGNLPPQQHSSPCQKYSSLDLAFRWVKALFQKMSLFPFWVGNAKCSLRVNTILCCSFLLGWLIPWVFCFNEPSLALHWNWRSLVSLVWLINHSLLTVWGSSKFRKPWENN